MENYNVTGMSCAACVASVEKAVNSCSGVKSCAVSLLTNSMIVEGGDSKQIIEAIRKVGYDASIKGNNETPQNNKSNESSIRVIKFRLISSILLLIVLMYFSMGHSMLNLPIPNWLNENYLSIGLVQMILSAIIMLINNHFFISGFKALTHRAANMDTLVALGSLTSFTWSVVVIFLMSDAIIKGNIQQVHSLSHQLYFESAAMIVTLITLGKLLESISKGKTTDALKALSQLAPTFATIIKDGEEVKVDIKEVKVNDIFIVRPAESIPVDGIVIEGNSAVNQSALTGESIPVDKTIGDTITSATINQSGFLKARATRVGQDTTLSQIIKMVTDASASKAPIAKIADKVASIFVPSVIIISILTLIIWLLLGQQFAYALARAISVLVISCPCSLGLATPVAIMVGNGVGAKNGILFKTASSLEQTGKAQIVVLDKTGTITSGNPIVTNIISNKLTEEQLLQLAYSLENKSEHPLAKAIVEKAKQENIQLLDSYDFKALAGNGVVAKINNELIYGGSYKFISSIVKIGDDTVIKDLANDGKTPLLFSNENELLGIIAVCDTVKDDSTDAISQLKNMGLKTIMLTGDNKRTANAIANTVGVDMVLADILPEGKEDVIKELQKYGKVIMVGDGINDAVALTRADIGIAIGAATDVAIDAADVVLMKSSLQDVVAAIRLSKATLTNIHENLFWAFFYNGLGIPLAAGCFVAFGLTLNPMFGAAAMSLSSFCVVSNALRLNLVKIYNRSKDKKIKNEIKEDIIMPENNTKHLTVNGMMCPHCEKHVKTALEKIDGIETAIADHTNNSVIITCSKDVDLQQIKAAVTDAGYEFVDMK